MKSNQSNEISDSCSFLRDGGETHQEGLGMLLAQMGMIHSILQLVMSSTIRPGASPSDPLEHTAHMVSVWCLPSNTWYPQVFPQADSLPPMWRRSSCRRPPIQPESIQLFTQADTLGK